MEDQPDSRVIIVKNIPHGFYEKEMMNFFSQFGVVTRLRLLRSKKYLNSKGIAFVEFAYEDVAKIAAHTMNNYLMFEKLIKCEVLPKSRLPPSIFRHWKGKKISTIVRHKSVASRLRDDNEWNKVKAKKLKVINSTLNKLKELGIEYQCNMAEEKEEATIVDFLSLKDADESTDDSFVTCNSSPSTPLPRRLNSMFERKLSLSRSGMKRKLFSLPKFAVLNAARRLSL